MVFIIVMQLANEDMLKIQIDSAEIPTMPCDPKFIVVLKSLHCDDVSLMINSLTNFIAHADDGAYSFNNRDEMLKFCEMAYKAMSKWGLTAPVGQK